MALIVMQRAGLAMPNGGGRVDSGVLYHRGWPIANKLVDNC